MDVEAAVWTYFLESKATAALCERGGWPDGEALRVRIERVDPEAGEWRVDCFVTVEEVLMLGCGGEGERIPRQGYYRLLLDGTGKVREARLR